MCDAEKMRDGIGFTLGNCFGSGWLIQIQHYGRYEYYGYYGYYRYNTIIFSDFFFSSSVLGRKLGTNVEGGSGFV